MPRRPDPKRRAALLDAFTDYVLENGLADLSLRPAAAALGTSPQILLYYFGSKEQLISEGIAEVRRREIAMLAPEIVRGRREPSPVDALWRVWRWYTAPRRAPIMRLFFEVYGMALQHPERFAQFLAADRQFFGIIREAFVSTGSSRARASVLATFYLSALRGVLLDFLATGEHARIEATVKHVAAGLRGDMGGSGRRPGRRQRKP